MNVTTVQWFQQQHRHYFAEGISWLVCQWDACRNARGDYCLKASTHFLTKSLNGFSVNNLHIFPY
jgi:hypothetical protein